MIAKIEVPTKRCYKCDTAKPVAEFTKDKSRADGLNPLCKPCKIAKDAERRASHPGEGRAAWNKWYANPENRKKHHKKNVQDARRRAHVLINQFKSQPCMDCHQTFITDAMEFDHRPGTEKLFTLNYSTLGHYALETVLAEIEKCDVVCAICHRVRTRARRLKLDI